LIKIKNETPLSLNYHFSLYKTKHPSKIFMAN